VAVEALTMPFALNFETFATAAPQSHFDKLNATPKGDSSEPETLNQKFGTKKTKETKK